MFLTYMKRAPIFIVFFFYLSLVLCLLTMPAQAQLPEKKILVILPYTRDYPAHELLVQGFKDKLAEDSLFKPVLSYEYLDLGQHSGDDYLALTADFFKAKYTDSNNLPDYIVATDSVAPFLAKYGEEIFPHVPIVLTWNKTVTQLDEIPANATTVTQSYEADIEKNLELILACRPEVQKIYVVNGNSAYEGKTQERLTTIAQGYAGKLTFVYHNQMAHEEMLASIENAPDDAVIYYFQWSVDASGEKFVPAEVVTQVCEVATVPVFGSGRQYLGRGIVGGYVYNFEIIGRHVASALLGLGDQARDVVASEQAVSGNQYVFDWRQLQRWGISEKVLPEGSVVEFRQRSFWDLYRQYILIGMAVVLIQSILIIALAISTRKRVKAEEELKLLNESLETEVDIRTRELGEAIEEMTAANDELILKRAELEILATTDRLTQAFNRMKLDEIFAGEINRCRRYGGSFALIIAHIDHFKEINDQFGHQVGDEILVRLVELFAANIRKTDFLGRWGGEEFLIICPETSLSGAKALAENLRQIIGEHDFQEKYKITISLGIASFDAEDDEKSLLKKADDSLYRAKAQGRNMVCDN